ncbi:MAG: hypothetical protein ACRBDX_05400 [Gammaproteobacteria bacterium]
MNKKNKILLLLAAMMMFVSLVSALFYTVKTGLLPFQMGLLLFISLMGMYIGFGILIGAYRLVNKLN